MSAKSNRKKRRAITRDDRPAGKLTGSELLALLVEEIRWIATALPASAVGYHDYVWRNGTQFLGRRPCSDHPAIEDFYRRGRFEIKQCYANCQRWLLDHSFFGDGDGDGSAGGVRYFEGWFMDGLGVSIHHGWLVAGGVVIDPTLDVLRGRDEESMNRVGYLGVPVPVPVVRRNVLRTKCWDICSEWMAREAAKNKTENSASRS